MSITRRSSHLKMQSLPNADKYFADICFSMPTTLRTTPQCNELTNISTRRPQQPTSCISTSEHLDLQEPLPRISSRTTSALQKLYIRHNAEIHRGKCAHHLGRLSAEALDEARSAVSNVMHVPNADDIVFANNLVSAHTLLARAATASLRPGDEILLAVNLPDTCLHIWHSVARSRELVPRLVTASLTRGAVPDVADFAQFISGRTRISIVPSICPLTLQQVLTPSLAPFLRAVAAINVIDASMYAQHLPFPRLSELGSDFVIVHPGAISMPSGCVIAGKPNAWHGFPPVEGADHTISDSAFNEDDDGLPQTIQLTEPLDLLTSPQVWGPSPERFEPMSTAVATAITTAAAMNEHVENFSDDAIRQGKRLAERLHNALERCSSVSVFTPQSTTPEAPVACFTPIGAELHDVALSLESHGIQVDIGCLGLSVALRTGAGLESVLRVSFNPTVHSDDDVDKFMSTLDCVMESLSTQPTDVR